MPDLTDRIRKRVWRRDSGTVYGVLGWMLRLTDSLHWFKKLVGAVVTGVGTFWASTAQFGDLPWFMKVSLFLVGAVVVWPLLREGWLRFVRQFEPVKFFPTQGDKDNSDWGGLREELKSVRTAWVAFESANYLADTSGQYHESIERMMVLDCDKDDGFLDTYLAVRPTKETRNRQQIREQVKEAVGKVGVQSTRLVDAPIMNLVIGEPGTQCTWVRLHYQMPFTEADNWPDIVIEWRKHPEVVERIEDAYDRLWESDRASAPPDDWSGQSSVGVTESTPQT